MFQFRFVSPGLKRLYCLRSWLKSDAVIMPPYGDATAFAVEVKQIVIINNSLFRNERGSALCYR